MVLLYIHQTVDADGMNYCMRMVANRFHIGDLKCNPTKAFLCQYDCVSPYEGTINWCVH